MTKTVYVQKWEESERGWGTRPDGYSLHLSESDAKEYVKDYWDGMPKETPDEYSRPCGSLYSAEVDNDTYQQIDGLGSRFFSNDYPGDGGSDGWVDAK